MSSGPSASGQVNVLFTSAGRRVELLRAFRSAYAELSLPGVIVAVDADPLAPALREADRPYIVPRIGDPTLIPSLAEICALEGVTLLFPLVDRDIPILVRHRDILQRSGTRLMLPSNRAATITGDKWETHRFFRRLGIPSPQTWLPADLPAAEPGFPLFVKPRFGSAGEHVVRVDDKAALAYELERVPDPIVQEFLPGPEVTSDVCCDFDGSVLSVISRRRIEVRSGEVAKGVTVHDPEVVEACVFVAKALEARGPITVQCIYRDGRPQFTEINPRFGGGIPLSIAAGAPSPLWMLALAAGREIDPPPLGEYHTGLYLTRFDTSLILTEEQRAAIESRRL